MIGILDRLRQLSAAEEFFAELGLGFDPRVLDVHRLHILKRFNEHLRAEKVADAPDEEHLTLCRTCLERAYGEFVRPGAAPPKSFKVFNDARQQAGAFVSLASLKRD